MVIEKGKVYRIKGKYGDSHPTIIIEGEDVNVFGQPWYDIRGNPTVISYTLRVLQGEVPDSGKVYYGHVQGIARLVHESELEEE